MKKFITSKFSFQEKHPNAMSGTLFDQSRGNAPLSSTDCFFELDLDPIPEIDEKPLKINIKTDDLLIEQEEVKYSVENELTTCKIKLTHIPTGLTSECAANLRRSENMETALNLLKMKIYDHEYQLRTEAARAKVTPK